MLYMNWKTTLIVLASTVVLALVALSAFDSYQRQRDIETSNQFLASFERQVIEVNPTIYPAYVGLYQLEPDFNIAITSGDGKLYAQGSNQIRVELFPASEATYFNEYTEALITFEQPTKGGSNQFVLREKNKVRYGNRI